MFPIIGGILCKKDWVPLGCGGVGFWGKESLGEYGSGWGWDGTYPYVFDYTQTDVNIPMRYNNTISTSTPTINGTWVNYGSASSDEVKYPFCEVEKTNGQILDINTLTQMQNQISCTPHAYNAGNYYNFPAAAANMSNPTTSSICPKGWALPQNARNTSYAQLLLAYGIDYNASGKTNQDAALLNLPLSFLRSGVYSSFGTLGLQGNYGYYRMPSQSLYFNSGNLVPTDSTVANYGYSVRCVSR